MANSTKPGLVAVVTAALADLFSVRQSGDTRDKKLTASQLANFVSVNLATFINIGGGVGLRNNGGVLEVRDSTNATYQIIAGATVAALDGSSYAAKLHSTAGCLVAAGAQLHLSDQGTLGGITAGVVGIALSAAGKAKVTDGGAGIGSINGLRPPTSSTGFATTTQLPTAGECCIHKNTVSGFVYLAYNDGGTVKSVQLT